MIAPQTRRQVTVASIIAGFVVSCVLVWHASGATFSGYTTNPGDAWTSATVALTDDDSSNSAMFSLTGLNPGDTGQRCIAVTYSGNAAAPVRLYRTAASYTGTLGPYLTITVSEGPAGTYANTTCSNWTTGHSLYTGLLSDFATTKTDFASGVANANGPWTPYAATQAKVYKVAWSFASSAPNGTQGGSAGIGLTWEAQSTAIGATNLALGKTPTSSSACNGSETAAKAFNGSISDGTADKFCSAAASKYLQVDLESSRTITSFTVRHAAAGGESSTLNTKDFDIDVSSNGSSWTNVVQERGANAAVTNHVVSTSGRYVKLTIISGEQASDAVTRIYEFEIYGT